MPDPRLAQIADRYGAEMERVRAAQGNAGAVQHLAAEIGVRLMIGDYADLGLDQETGDRLARDYIEGVKETWPYGWQNLLKNGGPRAAGGGPPGDLGLHNAGRAPRASGRDTARGGDATLPQRRQGAGDLGPRGDASAPANEPGPDLIAAARALARETGGALAGARDDGSLVTIERVQRERDPWGFQRPENPWAVKVWRPSGTLSSYAEYATRAEAEQAAQAALGERRLPEGPLFNPAAKARQGALGGSGTRGDGGEVPELGPGVGEVGDAAAPDAQARLAARFDPRQTSLFGADHEAELAARRPGRRAAPDERQGSLFNLSAEEHPPALRQRIGAAVRAAARALSRYPGISDEAKGAFRGYDAGREARALEMRRTGESLYDVVLANLGPDYQRDLPKLLKIQRNIARPGDQRYALTPGERRVKAALIAVRDRITIHDVGRGWLLPEALEPSLGGLKNLLPAITFAGLAAGAVAAGKSALDYAANIATGSAAIRGRTKPKLSPR